MKARVALLAVCIALSTGDAFGEEAAKAPWTFVPVTPTQTNPEGWLLNEATGELWFCRRFADKEVRRSPMVVGLCNPVRVFPHQ